MALVELSVVEQRYRAVLEAAAGVPVTEVAARYEVSRQSVHAWMVRYREGGLGALADRPKRPDTCPHQVSAEVEAAVCEMRREHPRWGPARLVYELAKAGVSPVPSRMSAYRALVRHGLVEPGARKRRKDSYQRWEREAPMALWQIDIMGGAFLADGTEAKIVTGVDDHSRYCVICQVVVRATGRAVCLAFAAALREFGVPGEVLTDNGKQFTDRFGKGGEVLFDRICRDNAIIHRLTRPGIRPPPARSSGSTAVLRRELLNDAVPFTDLAAAQAAVDGWVGEYNTTRPHQAIGMATPGGAVQHRRAAQAEAGAAAAAAARRSSPWPRRPSHQLPSPSRACQRGSGQHRRRAPIDGGPVEFDRVVPPIGNMWVAAAGSSGSARPGRDDGHLLGRHPGDPPVDRRGPDQVAALSPVGLRPGPARRHRRPSRWAAAAATSRARLRARSGTPVAMDGLISLGGRRCCRRDPGRAAAVASASSRPP